MRTTPSDQLTSAPLPGGLRSNAILHGRPVQTTEARIVDVSQIVWLRKRIGRARLATKWAGILVGVTLGLYSLGLTDSLGAGSRR